MFKLTAIRSIDKISRGEKFLLRLDTFFSRSCTSITGYIVSWYTLFLRYTSFLKDRDDKACKHVLDALYTPNVFWWITYFYQCSSLILLMKEMNRNFYWKINTLTNNRIFSLKFLISILALIANCKMQIANDISMFLLLLLTYVCKKIMAIKFAWK